VDQSLERVGIVDAHAREAIRNVTVVMIPATARIPVTRLKVKKVIQDIECNRR
jgi:hypothetical protein